MHNPAPRPPPLLQAESLSKQYGGRPALQGVSLELRAGEVVALVGENGAGKSTLVRILAGVTAPGLGSLRLDGAAVRFSNPAEARSQGIAVVHQDFDLAPNLTIAENLVLGSEPERLPGFVDGRRQEELARGLLALVGLDRDPATLVAELGVAERQLVAIACALATPVRLLILDEPTSSLAEHDIAHLLALVQERRAAGTAILFISHKLDEVFAIADRVVILRDGCVTGVLEPPETSREEVVSLMVGRELRHRQHREARIAGGGLEVRGLLAPRLRAPIDLHVRAGEIVGLYGLKGAGRFDLLRALAGFERHSAGKVLIGGQPVRIRSPRDAIRHGLAWVCRDRKELGLFDNLDVGENLTLAALAMPRRSPFSRWGFIAGRAERNAASEAIRRFGIRTAGARQDIASLSGGNQQKVLLARCLLCEPRVLILDEPTAGIDVAARSEIHALMHELAARGMAILLVSSELPEVLALSDRVLVMQAGALAGALDRAQASEERIMRLIQLRPDPLSADALGTQA